MADLVVYGLPLSPFVRKMEVALTAKGLEHGLESMNVMAMPKWFQAIGPARRTWNEKPQDVEAHAAGEDRPVTTESAIQGPSCRHRD